MRCALTQGPASSWWIRRSFMHPRLWQYFIDRSKARLIRMVRKPIQRPRIFSLFCKGKLPHSPQCLSRSNIRGSSRGAERSWGDTSWRRPIGLNSKPGPSFPLPKADDTPHPLSRLKWLTTLDLKNDYWQVTLVCRAYAPATRGSQQSLTCMGYVSS
jgi:hypothetical protein